MVTIGLYKKKTYFNTKNNIIIYSNDTSIYSGTSLRSDILQKWKSLLDYFSKNQKQQVF